MTQINEGTPTPWGNAEQVFHADSLPTPAQRFLLTYAISPNSPDADQHRRKKP